MTDEAPKESKPPILLAEAIAAGAASRTFSNFGTDPGWVTGLLIVIVAVMQFVVLFWQQIRSWLSRETLIALKAGGLPVLANIIGTVSAIVAVYNVFLLVNSRTANVEEQRKLTAIKPQSEKSIDLASPTEGQDAPSAQRNPFEQKSILPESALGPYAQPLPPSATTPPPSPNREFTAATTEYLAELCADKSYDDCKEAVSPFIGKWLHINDRVGGLQGYKKSTGYGVLLSDLTPNKKMHSEFLYFGDEYREYIVSLKRNSEIKAACQIETIRESVTTLNHCEPEPDTFK